MKDRGRWTTVAEIVATLERRWASGRYLRDYASGEPWEPVRLAVKAPGAADLLENLDAVREWTTRFERDSLDRGRPRFAIEYRTIPGRHVGANKVPHRIVVESFEQMCSLLGATAAVRSLDAMLALTEAKMLALLPWLKAHPLVALENEPIWPDLLTTVAWMRSNQATNLYLRHIDVAGVDTKFVEKHHQVLAQLLVASMPEEARSALPVGTSFAARFGYLSPPPYTRLRFLDSTLSPFGAGITEVSLRTAELAAFPLAAQRVFVVENEVTYLAFPLVRDAVVVFGSGFNLISALALPWLAEREVVYWGDIDTYGFEILDRLRARLPTVTSILMDTETLLAHRKQWVVEPVPTNKSLHHLSPEEAALYSDLVEDRYGHHVRLEQERVRFGRIRRALAEWA